MSNDVKNTLDAEISAADEERSQKEEAEREAARKKAEAEAMEKARQAEAENSRPLTGLKRSLKHLRPRARKHEFSGERFA